MNSSGGAISGRGLPVSKWLPAVIWAATIFILSTSYFTAINTFHVTDYILRSLWPSVPNATAALCNTVARESAHFTVYGVLFWLLIRGPMAKHPYLALAACVAYALTDEAHQILVAGRTPSLYDVALDSSGALFSRFLHATVAEPLI